MVAEDRKGASWYPIERKHIAGAKVEGLLKVPAGRVFHGAVKAYERGSCFVWLG